MYEFVKKRLCCQERTGSPSEEDQGFGRTNAPIRIRHISG